MGLEGRRGPKGKGVKMKKRVRGILAQIPFKAGGKGKKKERKVGSNATRQKMKWEGKQKGCIGVENSRKRSTKALMG